MDLTTSLAANFTIVIRFVVLNLVLHFSQNLLAFEIPLSWSLDLLRRHWNLLQSLKVIHSVIGFTPYLMAFQMSITVPKQAI